jgi:hypothetical protein
MSFDLSKGSAMRLKLKSKPTGSSAQRQINTKSPVQNLFSFFSPRHHGFPKKRYQTNPFRAAPP